MELQSLIDRLAEFPPDKGPFVTVYIDARPDQVGRDKYRGYVRTELKARVATYPERSAERQSVERDADRVLAWLDAKARPEANGIALFACSRANVFEAVQL